MLTDAKKIAIFVDKTFLNGFAKRSGQGVSRIFFEAIAVGVHLALQKNQT